MSDQRLRELERRWRETGDVKDEASFLVERRRAGELTQERLELAACCGHEGARLALGATAPARLLEEPLYEEATRGVDWLLIGLADPFPLLLENISVAYLESAWDSARRATLRIGLQDESLAYGAIGGPFYPEPEVGGSPALGFGWVASVQPNSQQLDDLVDVASQSSPRLLAAVGSRRVFRPRATLSHINGLVMLAEWCLDAPEWPRELGHVSNALGRMLMALANQWHGGSRPPSPFGQAGVRAIREPLVRWALM